MSDETGKARDTLAAIDELFVKHADEWVRIQECWWKISGNPVFVWRALNLALDPRRAIKTIPEWVIPYLRQSADSLNGVFSLEPGEVPPLLGQAIGLSAQGRSIIADANQLLEAPIFVATFERLLEEAPSSQRAEWAREEMRKMFGFQSTEVVRQRLTESRETMHAFLIAGEQVADTEAVNKVCSEMWVTSALSADLFADAEIPKSKPGEMRKDFGSRTPRREALRTFLKRAGEEGG